MPQKLFSAQRRLHYERGEKEINDDCWVWIGSEEPPCSNKMFDYGKRCYKSSVEIPRTPTFGKS